MSVCDFVSVNGWQIVEDVDLGTTARVFVVEREGQRQVLKTLRDEASSACPLRVEHGVLCCLNGTAMAPHVPRVGEWIDAVGGFLMEYLRFPTPAERDAPAFVRDLAAALRTLHALEVVPLAGVEDDRQSAGAAVSHRLRASLALVNQDDVFGNLAAADRDLLASVRVRYDDYVGMLPALEATLAGSRCTLTHGDLSGDNLMVRGDGSLALADWGEARITSPLTDVANLLVYAGWGEEYVRRFLHGYFGGDGKALAHARPAIDLLSQLYTYEACIKSLYWISRGELDVVGRTFFEAQLGKL